MPKLSAQHDVDALRRSIRAIQSAAADKSPISGYSHLFYRYPARFSPWFVRAAIEEFSHPGDVVLDPFMGGGTSVVESLCLGRNAVGSDVNSLAVFVASVKTTPLSTREIQALHTWAQNVVPGLRCNDVSCDIRRDCEDRRTYNLTLPRARHLKKMIAVMLGSLDGLPSRKSSDFARCALLNVGQWALNGRKRIPSASEFRFRVSFTLFAMLDGISEFADAYRLAGERRSLLIRESAASLPDSSKLRNFGLADLVVCSPPYPGIHMLYHRWQVDGRKETPAPYWITNCHDGEGTVFYNFADRRSDHLYFERLRNAVTGIRQVCNVGAFFIQLVSFAEPKRQLALYLKCMNEGGFEELRGDNHLGYTSHRRLWRAVPNRRWHANMKGELKSSREIVLIHRAI